MVKMSKYSAVRLMDGSATSFANLATRLFLTLAAIFKDAKFIEAPIAKWKRNFCLWQALYFP